MKTEDTFTYAIRKLDEVLSKMDQLERTRVGIAILTLIADAEEKKGA